MDTEDIKPEVVDLSPAAAPQVLDLLGLGNVATGDLPRRLAQIDTATLIKGLRETGGTLAAQIDRFRDGIGVVLRELRGRLDDGPYGAEVDRFATATGFSQSTLYRWRKDAEAVLGPAVGATERRADKGLSTGPKPKKSRKGVSTMKTRPDLHFSKKSDPGLDLEETRPPAPPAPAPTPPRPEPQTMVPEGGGTVGEESALKEMWGNLPERMAVDRFLAMLRSCDPAELGAAMTADETAEVRRFVALLVPLPPPRLTPPIVRRPVGDSDVKPKCHAPTCICIACVPSKAAKG